MIKPRWILAPVVAAFVLLAAACGGDDKDNNPASKSTGGGGTASSQVLDLTNATKSLLDVRSFRFDMSMKLDVDAPKTGNDDEDAFGAALLALFGNINASGAYVGPDRFEVKTKFFGQDIHMIQIGTEAWVNDGSGWRSTDADDDLGMLGGSPEDLFEMLPQEVLRGAKTKSEKVNGQETTRYSFDKDSLAKLAQEMGEDFGEIEDIDELNLDVWVTRDGLPVKMLMKARGEAEGAKMDVELAFNVTDLNDSGIKIEKPKL